MSIAEFIETTNAAETADEVRAHLIGALRHLGFENVAYSHLSRYQTTGDLGNLALIVTYPDDWVARYARKGYAEVDPVAHMARHCRRAFSWRVVTERELMPRQRLVMDECRAAGMETGVTVPLFGPRGDTALLSVAGQGVEDSHRVLRSVASLAAQFHMVHEEMTEGDVTDDVPPFVPLSPREREVLVWSARGKSTWEIGEIIGISERSVTFHVNNAMRKLDTSSRIMAVLKAIRHGLIAP